MGILDVIDGVLVRARQRQVHVEGELGVALAGNQEEAHGVAPPGLVPAARPLDQVTQRDVAARTLGDLHLLTVAHDAHHLVQHVVRVALRDAHVQRLQPGANPRHRAVVIRTLDVDGLGETPLPLAQVIGHVRHEIGVAAFGLAHHAVLVVTVVGGAQPQRAVLLEGVAAGHQSRHGLFHLAVGVERRLQVVTVERHAKGRQVQVLFTTQAGHRKAAHCIQVIQITRGRLGRLAIHLNRLAGHEGPGDLGDVVAAVAIGREGRIIRRNAAPTCLHGQCQIVDLRAGVVVIELAVNLPALRGQKVAQHVTQCRLAAMAHVQRAGGVGRDELQHHLLAVGRLLPELFTLGQHLVHHALVGGGREPEVDEARAGDLGLGDEIGCTGLFHQRGHQLLGHRTRRLLQRTGQLHGQVGGQIPMVGLPGALERRRHRRRQLSLDPDGLHRVRQKLAQFIQLCWKHPRILEPARHFGRPLWAAPDAAGRQPAAGRELLVSRAAQVGARFGLTFRRAVRAERLPYRPCLGSLTDLRVHTKTDTAFCIHHARIVTIPPLHFSSTARLPYPWTPTTRSPARPCTLKSPIDCAR